VRLSQPIRRRGRRTAQNVEKSVDRVITKLRSRMAGGAGETGGAAGAV